MSITILFGNRNADIFLPVFCVLNATMNHNNTFSSTLMLNQQLKGIASYANGLPFNGSLRIRKSDGNAIQEMFREIPIVNGVIPDYVRLYPGIYEIQWLPSTPDGLLPSEEWLIPEANELNINDVRDRYSLPTLLAQKDEIIQKLQDEIARLKAPLPELEVVSESPNIDEVIDARIEELTGAKPKKKSTIKRSGDVING